MRRCRTLLAACCLAFFVAECNVQAQPPGRPGGRGESGAGAGGQRGGPSGRQGQGGRLGQGGRQGQEGQTGQPAARWFGILDANSDGEISSAEINNASVSLLKLDRNRDGILTGDELRPAGGSGAQGRSGGGPGGSGGGPQMRGEQGQVQGQRGGAGGTGGPGSPGGSGGQGSGGGGKRGGGGGRGGDAAFAAQIMSLDGNNDGLIAVAELPEHMHEAFEIADADKSGSLNDAELLVLASQFRRNKLNPDQTQEIKNAPTQGRSGPGEAGGNQRRGN